MPDFQTDQEKYADKLQRQALDIYQKLIAPALTGYDEGMRDVDGIKKLIQG